MSAAWVIYDGEQRRVLAARDAEGSAAMHWGTTEDGRFMFGSDPIDLTDCDPTATPFPAGVPAICCVISSPRRKVEFMSAYWQAQSDILEIIMQQQTLISSGMVTLQ